MRPDDSFGDLGPDQPPQKKKSAAERFEEEDRLRPEPDMPKPAEPRRGTNKYAWVVGIAMLMGICVLLLTTALPNTGAGLEGPPHREAPAGVRRTARDERPRRFRRQRAPEPLARATTRRARSRPAASAASRCSTPAILRERPTVLTSW